MYLFWFKKPVCVRDPTMVSENSVQSTLLFGNGNHPIEFMDSATHTRGDPMICRHTNADISHFLTARPSNARDTAYEVSGFWAVGLFIATFAVFAAYAAVHLAAWNFRLPTHVEKYVWRASCITILAGSLLAPMWLILVDAVTDESYHPHNSLRTAISRWHDWHDQHVSTCFNFSNIPRCWVAWVKYSYIFLSMIFVPLFFCARAVIIIESFVSLRKVPEGVYVAVPWTEYLPHV
jgi:hypothetical protein